MQYCRGVIHHSPAGSLHSYPVHTSVNDCTHLSQQPAHRVFHRIFHCMSAGLLPTFRSVPSNRMPSSIRHVSQPPSSIWIITAAPFSSSQHNTAQQLHAVSNGHVDQPPCLSTVSPHHRVSHKCRWHPSPPWSSRSYPAVRHSHLPKPTHDDEHWTAAFALRPSLRILSRDLSLVLHHPPSRLL